MKAYKGVEMWLCSFFNLYDNLGGWSTPRPGRFTTGKKYGNHLTGRGISRTTFLDEC